MGATQAAAPCLREFRRLYQGHYGFVWATVSRFGVPPEAIDDVVQDAFVTAYRRWFDRHAVSPKPWLYGIARRISSNYRRSAYRRTRKEAALQAEPQREPAFDQRLIAGDLVSRFLSDLSAKDRELFILSEVEGMSGPELASALQMNMSTAYDRARVLRGRLRVVASDEALEPSYAAEKAQRPKANRAGWLLLTTKVASVTPAVGMGLVPLKAALAAIVATAAIGGALVSAATTPTSAVSTGASEAASASGRGDGVSPVAVVRAPPSPVIETVEMTTPPILASSGSDWSRQGQRKRGVAPTPEHAPSAGSAEPLKVSSLAHDTAIVRQASDALQSRDYARALQLTASHAMAFPNSALADLREALTIEALCESGSLAEGRTRQVAFADTFPRSPAGQRVSRLCDAPLVEP